VACSGTAFTDETHDSESRINNLGLIQRLSPNIIFAFDGDDAGVRATNRASMIALSLDMQVKTVILSSGKDPADIIFESVDKWKSIIKNSTNIIEFHLDRICKSTNDIRIRGRNIRNIIFPFLTMIKSSIERSAYITSMHSKTGIDEKAIVEDFESYERAHDLDKSKEKNIQVSQGVDIKDQSRRSSLEKKLFGIIFWQNQSKEKNIDINSIISDFTEKIGIDIFQKMQEIYEPFSDTMAFQAEMWYVNKIDDINRDIKEVILNLEEEILNERLVLLLDEINKKEREGQEDLGPILLNYQKIVERIEDIKNSRFK
jgi:DNA primase